MFEVIASVSNTIILSDVMMIVPGSQTLSLIVWGGLIILLLYLARHPAHLAIMSIFNTFYAGFRMASRSVMLMAKRMAERNREVLIAAGYDAAERRLEREFLRLDSAVKRDLGNYPALHREVQEKMAQLEQDYRDSTEEQPPNIEGWEKAINAVAKIPSKGSTMVADVLSDINESFTNTHKDVIKEYRRVNKERHKILGRIIPIVRGMSGAMDEMNKNIRDLTARAKEVGKYMDEFAEMRAKSDKAHNMLASSSLFQFFISGLILVIAIGGAVFNFELIKTAMSEMVGGSNAATIGGLRASNVAALVIIMIEIAMGLFLMELLRITRLFPGVGTIDDRMRKRLIWVSFLILLLLACVESGLAYMRDVILENKEITNATIAGTTLGSKTASDKLGLITQMTLGFVLPFALVFIAIPLESFVHSSLTALRTIGLILLRFVGFLLRLVGNIFRHIGYTVVRFYDLVIIVPLWLEYVLSSEEKRQKKGKVRLFQ